MTATTSCLLGGLLNSFLASKSVEIVNRYVRQLIKPTLFCGNASRVMHKHVSLQRITSAKRLLTNSTGELGRQVLLLVRTHIRWIRARVRTLLPLHNHPTNERLFALVYALMIGQRILGWEATITFLAKVGFLIEVRGLVLLEFRLFTKLLLTEVAGTKAILGVPVRVAGEFALILCALNVIATNPATFESCGFQR